MVNNKVYFLVLLLVLQIINQIDRNLIAAFAPEITAELDLSNTQFGILTGILFAVFYSIGGVFVGMLADRYSRVKVTAAGLFLWSLVTAATGFAKSFAHIAIARMFVSVGESSLNPSATSMIADKFSSRRRATANSLFFMGIPLGLGSAFLVADFLGSEIGWRNTFIALGGVGMLLVLFLGLVREPERQKVAGEREDAADLPAMRDSLKQLGRELYRSKALRFAVIGAVAIHFFYGGQVYAILWFSRELNITASSIISTYGAVAMSMGIAGSILGGVSSDWYFNKMQGSRATFIVIATAVALPVMLMYRFVEPLSSLFYLGMCSGFFYVNFIYGSAFSLLQDICPSRLRATIVGITMLSVNIIALGLLPVGLGALSDLLSRLGSDTPLTICLIISDLMVLLVIPCYLQVRKHTRGGITHISKGAGVNACIK